MKKILLGTLFVLSPLLSESDIEVYTAYGNPHRAVIEGRVLNEREFTESSVKDSWLKNTWRKLKHVVNDEEKNAPITLTIGRESFKTKTDHEGYFEFELINQSPKAWKNHQNIELKLDSVNKFVVVSLYILDEKVTQGILSDFDDTVIVSNVTSKMKLLKNTFLKNYKQREVVPEMLERFKKLTLNENTPLFFITGSPRQLQPTIHLFLNHHGFPQRTIITKKAHGKNPDSLTDQLGYKLGKIERIIKLYPHVEWYCFGDSGEKDREVYESLAKKYPKSIRAIYIRDVESGKILTIKAP